MSFKDVLERYASTHNDTGTDKTTSHSYGELYSELFAPLKERARRVLEIGVYSGASVLAMADYFENADVVGVDVTLKRIRFGRDHPRIRFVLGDGTSPVTASLLGNSVALPFDLILDDGSHRLVDQIAALNVFAPYLNPDGGIFVIEDIAGDHRLALEAAAQECSPRLFLSSWHDRRSLKNQFDDIVAVFKVAS